MVSNLYNNHSASNEETSSCIDNYACIDNYVCIDNYEATHIVEFKFAIHLQSQLKILPCIIKYPVWSKYFAKDTGRYFS